MTRLNTARDRALRILTVIVLLVPAFAGAAHLHPAEAATADVWGWGSNSQGEVGNGTPVDQPYAASVSGLTGVTSMGGGRDFSLAALSDGTVWGWGNNASGQLGQGTYSYSGYETPVSVPYLTGFTSVAAGFAHSLALRSDGTVWAWGDDTSYAVGPGGPSGLADRTPTQVAGVSKATAISAGYAFSLALESDGTVWGWGENGNGELGNATTTTSAQPRLSKYATPAVAIAAGYGHTLVLAADGTVWASGDNSFGELGTGNLIGSDVPVRVSGLSNVVAISAGSFYSLALARDGTIWSWGWDAYGQLGTNNIPNNDCHCMTSPVHVPGLAGVTALSAGGYHALARTSDGSIWAWGWNRYGQLGNNSPDDSAAPVRLLALQGDVLIAAGWQHSLAVAAAGQIPPPPPPPSPPAPPSAPLDLKARPGNLSGTIDLSWNPPTWAGGALIQGYVIYRGTSSGGETEISTLAVWDTTFLDNSVSPRTAYYYEVRADNSFNRSVGPPSNEACADASPWVTALGCLTLPA